VVSATAVAGADKTVRRIKLSVDDRLAVLLDPDSWVEEGALPNSEVEGLAAPRAAAGPLSCDTWQMAGTCRTGWPRGM